MVVTNYEPQYGELDPVSVTFRPLGTVAELEADQDLNDICYPVDGDMMNRAEARARWQWAEELGDIEFAAWAAEELHVDRMGITGRWVHDHRPISRVVRTAWGEQVQIILDRMTHTYRRWAEL